MRYEALHAHKADWIILKEANCLKFNSENIRDAHLIVGFQMEVCVRCPLANTSELDVGR